MDLGPKLIMPHAGIVVKELRGSRAEGAECLDRKRDESVRTEGSINPSFVVLVLESSRKAAVRSSPDVAVSAGARHRRVNDEHVAASVMVMHHDVWSVTGRVLVVVSAFYVDTARIIHGPQHIRHLIPQAMVLTNHPSAAWTHEVVVTKGVNIITTGTCVHVPKAWLRQPKLKADGGRRGATLQYERVGGRDCRLVRLSPSGRDAEDTGFDDVGTGTGVEGSEISCVADGREVPL